MSHAMPPSGPRERRLHLMSLVIAAAMLAVALLACHTARGAEHAAVYTVHSGPIPSGQPDTNVLVVTHLYTLSLDVETKLATWCAFRVTDASQYGRNSLNRNWRHEFTDGTLEDSDYTGSDYQRGHLAPLASFRADADASQLNWTGNVAPQTRQLNAGPWLDMEDLSRELAKAHGRVMVTVGPLYEQPMPGLPAADEPHRVPSHYWAIIRVPEYDTVHAWIMPQSCDRGDPLEQFETTAAEISQRSGLTFNHHRRISAMSPPAGKLSQRIVIESPVKTRKASGQVVINSWEPLHSKNLPASYEPVSGGESVRGMQIVASAKCLFETRWLPNVTTECRIRWITGNPDPAAAPVLHIAAVDDPDGLRRSLAIQVRREE